MNRKKSNKKIILYLVVSVFGVVGIALFFLMKGNTSNELTSEELVYCIIDI